MRSSRLQSRAAVIKFTPRKDCFVSLPRSWSSFLNDSRELLALRIENGCDQSISTTWSGDFTAQENGNSYTSSDDVIEICGFFAAKQGFTNGQLVHVAMISNVTSCETVHVAPSSVDDWEILEMNAEDIERDLLNQVRLVSRGQTLPIWIQRKTCVFVLIETTDASCQYGLLNNNTELIVSPMTKQFSTNSSLLPPPTIPCDLSLPIYQQNGQSGKPLPSARSHVEQPEYRDERGGSSNEQDFDEWPEVGRANEGGGVNEFSSALLDDGTIYREDELGGDVFCDPLRNIYTEHNDENYDDDDFDDYFDDDDDGNFNNCNNDESNDSSGNFLSWIRRGFSSALSVILPENDPAEQKKRRKSQPYASTVNYQPELLTPPPVYFTARVLPLEDFLSSAHNQGGDLSRVCSDTADDGFCVCMQQQAGVFGSGEVAAGVADSCGPNAEASGVRGPAGSVTSRLPTSSRKPRTSSRLVRECHNTCHADCHSRCGAECSSLSCSEPPCRYIDEDKSERSSFRQDNVGIARCRSLCASTCPVRTGRKEKRAVRWSLSSTDSTEKHSRSRCWMQGSLDVSKQPNTVLVRRETVPEVPRDVKSFFARMTQLASPKVSAEAEKSKQRQKGSMSKEEASDNDQEQKTRVEKQEEVSAEGNEMMTVVRVVLVDYESKAESVGISEKERRTQVIKDWLMLVANQNSAQNEAAENNEASEENDEAVNVTNKEPVRQEADSEPLNLAKPSVDMSVLQSLSHNHPCFDPIRCKSCGNLRIPSEFLEQAEHLVEIGSGLLCLAGSRPVPQGHVLVPRCLRDRLVLGKSSRVKLRSLEASTDSPGVLGNKPVYLYALNNLPEGFRDDMIETAVRHYIHASSSVSCPFLLNSFQLIHCFLNTTHRRFPLVLHVGEAESLSVKAGGEKPDPYFLISSSRVMRLLTLVYKGCMKPWSNISDLEDHQLSSSTSLRDICTDKLLIQPALSQLSFCLNQHSAAGLSTNHSSALNNGAILLVGPKGVGKTTVAKALCSEASRLHHAYVERVECRDWRGKRPDSIQQKVERIFEELRWRQPALLLLDDLDEIVPPPRGPEEELSSHHTLTAIMFRELIQTELCRPGSKVVVIATAQSRSALNAAATNARGVHLFGVTIELKAPDQTEREAILQKLLSRHFSPARHGNTVNVKDAAARTENFVARDLELIVSRALLHAVSSNTEGNSVTTSNESTSSRVLVSEEDLLAALQDFTPASLRDVPLVTSSCLGWRDVGGLQAVRSTLVETLEWPFLYRRLYAQCPIRMSSGILLYGAPGTGKTLLAAVVAKEFNFNFVSVKGPELLNKYIGASEQAVRNIFQRAQSAKPCILFFDEFDSLAPRRGHDSTGVTDRVVNQLLTQLDGVESLEGVYVLAATSRPDLIDPALLRPGRLDKAIYCSIPSQEERWEILQALGRQMTFAQDVDLRALSDDQYTGQLTGADLKALLYDAQISAIHLHQRALMARGLLGSAHNDVDGNSEKTLSALSSPFHFSLSSNDLELSSDLSLGSVSPSDLSSGSGGFESRGQQGRGSGGSAVSKVPQAGAETRELKGKVSLVQVEVEVTTRGSLENGSGAGGGTQKLKHLEGGAGKPRKSTPVVRKSEGGEVEMKSANVENDSTDGEVVIAAGPEKTAAAAGAEKTAAAAGAEKKAAAAGAEKIAAAAGAEKIAAAARAEKTAAAAGAEKIAAAARAEKLAAGAGAEKTAAAARAEKIAAAAGAEKTVAAAEADKTAATAGADKTAAARAGKKPARKKKTAGANKTAAAVEADKTAAAVEADKTVAAAEADKTAAAVEADKTAAAVEADKTAAAVKTDKTAAAVEANKTAAAVEADKTAAAVEADKSAAALEADKTAAAAVREVTAATATAGGVVVTWEQLVQAARDLRPSVTPVERKRFEQIYEQFVASRSKLLIGQENVGQRSTLA